MKNRCLPLVKILARGAFWISVCGVGLMNEFIDRLFASKEKLVFVSSSRYYLDEQCLYLNRTKYLLF